MHTEKADENGYQRVLIHTASTTLMLQPIWIDNTQNTPKVARVRVAYGWFILLDR